MAWAPKGRGKGTKPLALPKPASGDTTAAKQPTRPVADGPKVVAPSC